MWHPAPRLDSAAGAAALNGQLSSQNSTSAPSSTMAAHQFMNWIKSPAGRSYFFSTHFWGPVANWGLPLAALSDVFNKDEEYISGVMSPTLAVYSMIFMRFAWRVIPRNYLLLACHGTNAAAQTVQELRYINYWHFGGREKKHPELVAEDAAADASQEIKDAAHLVAQDKFSAAGGELKKAGESAVHAAAAGGEAVAKKGQEVKADVESKVKKELDALKK